ncbi:hypothetical protein JCM3765_002740 [Sporobolomyces pararoseus]
MPSSPPATTEPTRGGRTSSDSTNPHSSSVIVRTASSTTDDELLHLIENARSAVARARQETGLISDSINSARRERGTMDDAAATSLFQRHASRRDIELEWDERDTERRARELMARLEENPPPNNLVDVDDHSGDEGLTIEGVMERRGLSHYAGLGGREGGGGSVGELFGLPTFGGILRDSDDDEDEDDYMYGTGNVEEAIFGFDGDGDLTDYEPEREDSDMVYDQDQTSTQNPRLTSIWPGLLGERPLNPGNVSSPTFAAPPAVTVDSPAVEPVSPLDPSSSTSFTSFLSPGTTFIGQQVTSARSTSNSSRRNVSRETLPSQVNWPLQRLPHWDDQASTAHPAFAPSLVLPQAENSSSSSTATSRSRLPSSFTYRPDFLGPLRPSPSSSSPSSTNPMPPIDSLLTTDPISTTSNRSSSSSSSRYAPYSSHTATQNPSSTSSAATVPSAPIPPNLTPVERARMSIARSHNPAARSNPASWREVADELLVRLRREDEESVGMPERTSTGERLTGTREEERWEVQVNIHTYDPNSAHLTGLMSAYGIKSSQRDLSTHPTRVTTFFTASIIQPLESGLFVSPSPTGSGGLPSTDGIKVSQSTEAESWIQVGPFKGMKRSELLVRAKDWNWVEEKCRGWVLMRWKEKDFVNVKATESSLSINGFYFVALNRSTGTIEGLYSDPASSPYQRLNLSPCDPRSEGTFSLGTYSMC